MYDKIGIKLYQFIPANRQMFSNAAGDSHESDANATLDINTTFQQAVMRQKDHQADPQLSPRWAVFSSSFPSQPSLLSPRPLFWYQRSQVAALVRQTQQQWPQVSVVA